MRQKGIRGVKDVKNIKNRRYFYGAILKSKWFKNILACLAALGFFYPNFALAEDTTATSGDLMAKLMPLLEATFGPGSVVLKGFYLLVIGVGVWRYHVTGNLAPVASIVIVVLIVTFGMSHLVFG